MFMWQTAKNIFDRNSPHEIHTVLVLGAGASAHLGYPLGPKLCTIIIKNTSKQNSNTYTELLEMGFNNEKINKFHDQLSRSCPSSIDEFLSDRREFIDIGCAAITQNLIRYEDENQLHIRDNNWYVLLRDRVKSDINRNIWPPVIVTFNYDLSLDKFLYDFITSTYPRDASITTLQNRVLIYHVHGRLGCLDYETGQNSHRTYGVFVSPREILAIGQGIRIPCQLENDYGKDMIGAQKAINKAKRVIFLGFGYDKMNLDRLRVDSSLNKMKWDGVDKYFGTAYKLSRDRIQKIEELSENRLTLGDPNQTIFDYLSSALACWKEV